MLTEYVDAAMRKARFEFIPGERTYFGKIPGFKGLWASGASRKECETRLRECLEDWIVLSLRMNMKLPVMGKISLNETLAPVKTEPLHV